MLQLPQVYLIHADDAPQHQGRLQEILQQLQAEQRISNFHTLRHDAVNTLKDQAQNHDLVLTLLTYELASFIKHLEEIVQALRVEQPEVKTAEVIVDNLPYHNDFITFPADLKPIRSRDDMDAVWQDIKLQLQQMLPVQSEPTHPTSISIATIANIIFGSTIVIVLLTFLFAMSASDMRMLMDFYGFALITVDIIHVIGLIIVLRAARASNMVKLIIVGTLLISVWILITPWFIDDDYIFIFWAAGAINFIGLFLRKRKKADKA